MTLRAAPDGARLATIAAGTTVQAGERRDGWREVTLTGWIWNASVRPASRQGFDLVVSARDGENLRATPNGDRIARLNNGTLLVELERQGRWIRVRRTGWVQDGGIDAPAESAPAGDNAAANSEPPAARPESPAAQPESPAARSESSAAQSAAPAELSTPPAHGARAGRSGTVLLASPGGDSLATIRPLSDLEVVERRGDWVRVRIEGWVASPTLDQPADSGTILTGIAPEVLRSNPEAFRGRLVEWKVQFIAFDRAEKIRTDFKEDEPFILARPPGDQPGFVYLAATEEQLPLIRTITPLQWIDVVARVRTGRSTQMGAPVLELIEIR